MGLSRTQVVGKQLRDLLTCLACTQSHGRNLIMTYPIAAQGERLRLRLIKHTATARNAFTTRGEVRHLERHHHQNQRRHEDWTAEGSITTARRVTTDKERMVACSESSEDRWPLFEYLNLTLVSNYSHSSPGLEWMSVDRNSLPREL